MEVLRIAGYTEHEKHQIATKYLIPKQIEATGLTKDQIVFTPEAVSSTIQHYTREAGVRSLNRELATISRKVARKVVTEGKDVKVEVTPANLNEFLGILKYRDFFAEKKNEIGLTTGLAWTEVGGEVLSTEAMLMEGKGRLTLTGKLGDVMQESAQAAMSYIRSAEPILRLAQGFLPPSRHSYARSRRRHPERRAFGRHHHLHLHRQRAYAHPGSVRYSP